MDDNVIYLKDHYELAYNLAMDRYGKYDKHNERNFHWEHVEESLKQYSNFNFAYRIDVGIHYLYNVYLRSYMDNRPDYIMYRDLENLIFNEFLTDVFSGASRLAEGYETVV
ncbi:hypothetical protein ABGV42_01580 [Paenibacillus pabuli]|uniref:hypothetical protein n=1 Tax=Paenibacillus pabuli TaxID=1472 RepID=UPI003241C1CD